MKATKQQAALGTLLITASKLDKTYKGRKQLQGILGKSMFYFSQNTKKWYYNTLELREMTTKELDSLSKQIESSIK